MSYCTPRARSSAARSGSAGTGRSATRLVPHFGQNVSSAPIGAPHWMQVMDGTRCWNSGGRCVRARAPRSGVARTRSPNAPFRLSPGSRPHRCCPRLVAGSAAGRVALSRTPCALWCPGGGIGRHSSPPSCWPQGRAGSSPAPGTPALTCRSRRAYDASTWRTAVVVSTTCREVGRCSPGLVGVSGRSDYVRASAARSSAITAPPAALSRRPSRVRRSPCRAP